MNDYTDPNEMGIQIKHLLYKKRCSLFLDFDGTLVDLAATPSAVSVDAELLSLLSRLVEVFSSRLALVSGRSIASLDELLFPLRLDCAGGHGAELRIKNEMTSAPIIDSQIIEDLIAEVEPIRRRYPLVHIEHKGYSVALHWRGEEDPNCVAMLENRLNALIIRHCLEFKLLYGKCVIELVSYEASKGGAIKRIMLSSDYRETVPIVIGDDITDESAFQVVNELGCMSIHVGDATTCARFRLENTSSVRSLLNQLAYDG